MNSASDVDLDVNKDLSMDLCLGDAVCLTCVEQFVHLLPM